MLCGVRWVEKAEKKINCLHKSFSLLLFCCCCCWCCCHSHLVHIYRSILCSESKRMERERESKRNREIPDRLPHVEEMFSNWFLLFNAFSPISILIDLNESLSKCGSKMRSAQWFYYIKRLIKHRWNCVCVSFAFRIDRIESYGLRGLAFTFLIWMLFKSDKTIVLFVREEKKRIYPIFKWNSNRSYLFWFRMTNWFHIFAIEPI